MILKIKKLNEDAVVPAYANTGDAGMDLTAVSITRGDRFIQYNIGLAIEIPEGYVGLLFPRSSISKKDQMLANSVGVIDSGYRGEIGVRMRGSQGLIYEVGDRVAQLIIVPYETMELEVVDELAESERGVGGYGSTGQ